VGFVDEDGVERQEPLEGCAQHRFESGRPVRSFPSYRGQRNWPGWWWSATTGAHVGYESWLERDHAMALDFDADVVGFSAQPFWLFVHVDGQRRSHAPDFFARHRDGGATVVDCRPDHRIKPRDAAMFAATARACAEVGWSYRRFGALDEVLAANLRWLAGYRQARFANGFASPMSPPPVATRCWNGSTRSGDASLAHDRIPRRRHRHRPAGSGPASWGRVPIEDLVPSRPAPLTFRQVDREPQPPGTHSTWRTADRHRTQSPDSLRTDNRVASADDRRGHCMMMLSMGRRWYEI